LYHHAHSLLKVQFSSDSGYRQHHLTTVMWSETVGLRTRPVSDQKIGLGLEEFDLVYITGF